MPKEYTIQCPQCNSCVQIRIQPVNALIHLLCCKCNRVIFNSTDNTNNANVQPSFSNKVKSHGNVTLANRYRVIKQTEEDRYTRIYTAEDMSTGKKVFIRVFALKGEKVCEQFRPSMKFKHQNLYNYHDLGVHNGRYFAVYDFVEGDTLQYCLEQRRIIPRHVVSIILSIAKAIQYLHSNDYTGAEILSKNILISKDWSIRLQKYNDHIFINLDLDQHRSCLGISEGVAEMPLERIRNSKKGRTTASDVYALGAVLFEALTGVKVFSEYRTLDKLFYAKLKNNYKRIGEYNPYLSEKLVKIVECAMHHDAEQRLTLDDMIHQLQQALQLENQLNSVRELDDKVVQHFFQKNVEETLCTLETSMGDILEEDVDNKKVNGRYLLKRQLGTNSFLVFDEQQHRLAAMKVIKDVHSFSLLDKILKIASKPVRGVVEWYHCEQKATGYFLLLQKYMRGENLEIVLQKKAILTPHKVVDLCLQIVDALQYLHENKIACGDLTLRDIFVDIDNENKVCLVNPYLYHIKNSLIKQRPFEELVALDIGFVGSLLQKLLNFSTQASKIIHPPIYETMKSIIDEMTNHHSSLKQIKEKLQLEMVYNLFCNACGWYTKIQQDENWTCRVCKMHLQMDKEFPEAKYLFKSQVSETVFDVWDLNENAYVAYCFSQNIDKEKLKTLCFHQPLGIMRYMDFWQKNSKTYVVCEPLEGIALSEIIHKTDVSRLLNIIEKVGVILERLHRLHLVHGNLNVQNVLVNGRDVLLVDLQLSVEKNVDCECCDPLKKVNSTCDIYSLGIIIESIFSRAEFCNYKHYVASLIARLIAPESRFASMKEFLDELREVKQQFLL
ncbi:protein kinase [Candidatus Uabimicrobium amorphum]|uniref:Protein kinase n=1 Tax=Uabimicrobium amorphum TaxID=2596890 RepID=A0A5S9F795_UABAM|nr:protein kinase [Candidatus Uabimicrobium amorphum]BBM87394.1 protein kinase [Candidatus Uabimicrobium amorphum]